MTPTPGLIALASGELARYAHARTSIEALQRPRGTLRFTATGLSVAENFNAAAQTLLDQTQLQWMLLVNDDHVYPEDALVRLLDRMQRHKLEAVTALYLERNIPFAPVLFEAQHGEEVGLYTRRRLRKDDGDLIEVDACGDGCMLVHRRVIELLALSRGFPIWELGFGRGDARAQSNHDIAFCTKLRLLSVRIWADLTVRIGHMTPMSVIAARGDDGAWVTQVRPRPDSALGLQLDAPE